MLTLQEFFFMVLCRSVWGKYYQVWGKSYQVWGKYYQLWEDGTAPGVLPNTIVKLPELLAGFLTSW